MDRRAPVGALAVVMVAALGCNGSDPEDVPGDATVAIDVGPDPLFPKVGTAGYDVRHYDWDLSAEPESGRLASVASLDAVAHRGLDEIVLDYTGPQLSDVRLDGEDVDHSTTGSKLVVHGSRAAGEAFRVTAEYDGVPEPTTVEGLPGRFGWISTENALHTLAVFPGNTASWVPLNDTPIDPATFDISVTVPAGFTATASGRRTSARHTDGASTFEFRVEQPVHEVTVAVGEFVIEELERGDVNIEVALPADGSGPDIESFDDVPRMVDFLADRLGPLSFSDVGFTFVKRLQADADSTPGRINVRSTGEAVLVHELAHQWMGGMVGTSSTADSWLREGLPTYMEFLWLEAEGKATIEGIVALRRQQLGPSTRAPIDVRTPRDRIDDVTYDRGALAIHALHAELGDEAFSRGLRHFFQQHATTSATTEDFITSMSESSGRDLDALLDPWLRAERLPPAS